MLIYFVRCEIKNEDKKLKNVLICAIPATIWSIMIWNCNLLDYFYPHLILFAVYIESVHAKLLTGINEIIQLKSESSANPTTSSTDPTPPTNPAPNPNPGDDKRPKRGSYASRTDHRFGTIDDPLYLLPRFVREGTYYAKWGKVVVEERAGSSKKLFVPTSLLVVNVSPYNLNSSGLSNRKSGLALSEAIFQLQKSKLGNVDGLVSTNIFEFLNPYCDDNNMPRVKTLTYELATKLRSLK